MSHRFDLLRRKRVLLLAIAGLLIGLLIVTWLFVQAANVPNGESPHAGQEPPESTPTVESAHAGQELLAGTPTVKSPQAGPELIGSVPTIESPQAEQELMASTPTVESPQAGQGTLESQSSASLQISAPATETACLPLVATSDYTPPSVFGVDMRRAITISQGLSQALDADVSWVRFSAFQWDQIEPVRTEPPTYVWETVDEDSLRTAAANNIELIAVIQYTPSWAQQTQGISCGPIHEDRLDEFAQFLQALVTRYSLPPHNVRYWELGNEPDVDPSWVAPNSGYGCWGDNDDEYYGGRYYAEMLKVAYPAIKAVDLRAQVLIGGLLLDCDPRVPDACHGPEGDTPARFLEGILLNGGGPYFDIVSFHAYTYYYDWLGPGQMLNPRWPEDMTAIPEKADFVREVLAAYGYGDKKLMNTEAAVLCPETTEDCLETQAMYVPRAYAEAMALALETQIYFSLINEHWHHTGLLLPDLTPKPVYYAYKTASALLSPTTYIGAIEGYPAGVEGYAFRQQGGTGYLDVVWSQDGSAQSVDLPAGASAYDRYGNPIIPSGPIEVDYSPVYVSRPSLTEFIPWE